MTVYSIAEYNQLYVQMVDNWVIFVGLKCVITINVWFLRSKILEEENEEIY